ncbi:MAG: SEC-C domain-containing protein [Actinomycetota bacterium]|nr:SEC-C domain-containing protein [Actinomycetota bacterium]
MGLLKKITGLFAAPRGATEGCAKPATLPRRNALCWCGSGLKYKRCHLEKDQVSNKPKQGCSGPT